MDSLLFTPSVVPPHLHPNLRLSPPRRVASTSIMSTGRKRKAEDEGDASPQRRLDHDLAVIADVDDRMRMSASPSNSPAFAYATLPRARPKRLRPNTSSRALSLPRLLETLDAQALRSVLESVCERHPEISGEVISTAPRPTVESALAVLSNYESIFRASFPFGGSASNNYAYDRVEKAMMDLLTALGDFTPHFLPPNEQQMTVSLTFLDSATAIIHRLPTWDENRHNRHKSMAYEEISKAWASVIREAAKKGAGIQLQYGGWDQKISKHNELSEGRMQGAVSELSSNLGWMNGSQANMIAGDVSSIRQQLLSGTYGANPPIRVGPW